TTGSRSARRSSCSSSGAAAAARARALFGRPASRFASYSARQKCWEPSAAIASRRSRIAVKGACHAQPDRQRTRSDSRSIGLTHSQCLFRCDSSLTTGTWHDKSMHDGPIHRGSPAVGTSRDCDARGHGRPDGADCGSARRRRAPPGAAPGGPPRGNPPGGRAPGGGGEPIMAIVSIKSQKVTIYDADGWVLRAPVSSGTAGRETPAGVFSVVEKDKDHRSSLYD